MSFPAADVPPTLASVLPIGARWAQVPTLMLAGFVAAFGLTSWCGNIIARDMARLPEETHWSERVRYAALARGSTIMAVAAVCVACVPLLVMAAPVWVLRNGPLSALIILAASFGAITAGRRREVLLLGRPLSLGAWARTRAIATAIQSSHAILALAYGLACYVLDGAAQVIALCATPLFVAFGVALLCHPAVLSFFGLARPGSEASTQTTEEACRLLGAAPVKTLDLGSTQANAWAFPLWNAVAYSDRLRETATEQELVSIAVHEVAHLQEPRSWAYRRVLLGGASVTPLAFLANFFTLPANKAVLYLACAAFVSARAVTALRKLAQRAEMAADEKASRLLDATYARALERLYEVNLFPVVMPKAAIHPSLYDRMLAAGVQPTYPRPALPITPARYRSLRRPLAGWAQLLLLAPPLLGVALWRTVYLGCEGSSSDACLYVVGGSNDGLMERAEERLEAGDFPAANVIARAPNRGQWMSYAAYDIATRALAGAHDCEGLEQLRVHLERRTPWTLYPPAIRAHEDILDALAEARCPNPEHE